MVQSHGIEWFDVLNHSMYVQAGNEMDSDGPPGFPEHSRLL